MKILRRLLFVLLIPMFSHGVIAQETLSATHINKLYVDAMELFEKEKYAAAQNLYKEYIQAVGEPQTELSVNAEYYFNICSLYLFHKDAEFNLEQFVIDHPESAWVKEVYVELATYNYKRRKYSKALDWFTYVDPSDLDKKRRTEFYFKRGHCYFLDGDYSNAKLDFKQMLGEESEYQTPATYYYSHIAYEEGNIETALKGFNRLNEDPNFSPVVPYYITQIHYKQGNHDELLAYALPILDSAEVNDTKRVPEISRLVGDAYYRKNDFEKSLPHLELYIQNTSKQNLLPEDYYQLGYSYYVSQQYENALELFSACSSENSEIGQSASYFMGDCYLNLDAKTYARAAFKTASESDHNLQLKEDALFNYAKLAFELSYNPFHEAITAFETYLDDYPNSSRSDEAYEFLLTVYMKSKNYEAAIQSLDKIEDKDTRTQEAYQVVTFNRAVELFKTGDLEEAESYFKKVNTYPINYTLISEAIFWRGEIAYKQENYIKAFDLYKTFLGEAGSVNSGFHNEANYSAAYALFKQKKYIEATSYFRKFVDASQEDDQRKLNDAYLRLGDCYYVAKSFNKAIDYYDSAYKMNQFERDYALYQKAICHGLNKNDSKKIELLKQLIDTQTDSKFTADAKYNLARTYLDQDQLTSSATYFQDVIDNHSNTPYVKHSLVNLLLIAYKQQDDQQVILLWNKILDQFPNDPVRNEAYMIAEEILIENNVDIPENIVAQDELEARVFEIAENAALSGDCNSGVDKLKNYLNKYEPGIYATKANYLLANCYFDLGEMDDALNAYNYVINQPVSEYTEECLVVAATINFNNKNYEQAKNHYIQLEQIAQVENNELEAQIGLLRCYYWLDELTYALEYADKVIAHHNTPNDILVTAYLWRGKIRMDYDNIDQAYYDFAEVLKKTSNVMAAEAKYNMGVIAYIKEAYAPAEKEIFELINDYSSYNEWKYKGFLLLSDVYVGMEDYFQARATLNAILDNVSEPWVIDEARARLDTLDAIEAQEISPDSSNDIEIDLSGEGDDREEDEIIND